MQHHQQIGGYGSAEVVMSDEDQKLGDLGVAEAASPISSRPPAPAGIANANFEEMIQAEGGGSGGGSSSNRWPRQETLALLQIRSEMDVAFRDATLKGPLWEQVSRKLGELGYKRSAKKCKEKFENVHKYYKRTKEGRGGRQDGKSYKFFSQLEALHTPTSAALLPTMSSASLPPPMMPAAVSSLPPPADALFGMSFSSDGSSSEEGDDDDDDEEMMEMEMADDRHQRKRKRSHGGGGDERMMDFFEGLLKQVMQKQEAMQQRFLEAIEKREQDRMIREEAWKRQDMARVAREHELMAHERAVSASRDAAIIDFLQKITGQTIQLPATTLPQNNPPQEQQQQQPQPERRDQLKAPQRVEVTTTSEIIAAIPEQQMVPLPVQDVPSGSNVEASSSRWPKAEVIALIKLRSGMESRYQEAVPKGPLWEEISAGMKQIGYNRSSKRCKEKWENINKYFKKVKESNKKRPEDAKTCPYFNELDALYRRKIIGNTSTAIVGGHVVEQETKQQHDVGIMLLPQSEEKADGGKSAETSGGGGAGAFSSNLFGEHNQSDAGEGEKQPEDMLNKGRQQGGNNYSNSVNHSNSDDLDEDAYEEDDENEEYDEKTEEEMKMVYKIQFQRQNVGSSNGAGGTTSSSFVAMVQ